MDKFYPVAVNFFVIKVVYFWGLTNTQSLYYFINIILLIYQNTAIIACLRTGIKVVNNLEEQRLLLNLHS